MKMRMRVQVEDLTLEVKGLVWSLVEPTDDRTGQLLVGFLNSRIIEDNLSTALPDVDYADALDVAQRLGGTVLDAPRMAPRNAIF